MDHWNEIRTAACVAKLGTVNAASTALGVHRATVTRHIDMLEGVLGGKLFLRHARGFTATELGEKLLRVADATDEQFDQLVRHAKGQSDEISGELIITSLESLTPVLLPVINQFHATYPNVRTRFLSSDAVFKLEYGEAHVAFRAGQEPREPDNVVKFLRQSRVGLYATKDYVARRGLPRNSNDYKNHCFVGLDREDTRIHSLKWMTRHVPKENIVFAGNKIAVLEAAVRSGTGIGFVADVDLDAANDLVEVHAPIPEWCANFWVVTHVDLHRTRKVQAFLQVLNEVFATPRNVPEQ